MSADFDQKEIFEVPFPDELYGVVIEGIDLTILSLDSVRLVHAYARQDGELSEIQVEVLYQCDRELKLILPKVDGVEKKYLRRVWDEVGEVIKKLEAKK